jgi:hypothetical protein
VTLGEKLRRAIVWLPVLAVCAWAGGWFGVLVDPHGMSYGMPLSERFAMIFTPSANPPVVLLLNALVGASLVLADVFTPRRAHAVMLCAAGLFAGALYYELLLGNYIDTLFADWPPVIGGTAELSSLLWPHLALVATKWALNATGRTDDAASA